MFRRLLIACFLLLFACQPAASQTPQFASWKGVLRGANGQPLRQAKITLRAVPPRTQFEGATDDTGNFSFAQLPPGTYTLAVRWRGVNARAANAISVRPGERFEAWLELAPGGRILIHANRQNVGDNRATPGGVAPKVNASTGGEKLSSREVSSLPLNGRDFGQLLLLAAGTMTDTNGAANYTQQYAVNGQRGATAVFAMDGIDVSDPEMGGATFNNFNVDAIQEIKSSSGVLPARIGEGAASFIDVITKSGADQVHGAAFEFLRNSSLDARNFFDRQSSVNPGRLPHFERNEFGFTNGGPVVLPGIYNGRNKTWYFGEYQGFRQILGTTQVISVPTPSERLGLDTTAFPGDTLAVPVNPRILPVLDHYPLPNDPEGPYGARTFATSAPVATTSDQFSVRIDHRISSKAKLFSRFTFDNIVGPISNPNQLAVDPSFAIRFFDNERNFGLRYIRNLSPTLVSESSFGFTRATPMFPSINKTQPALAFSDGLFESFNAPGGTQTGAYGNLFQFKQDWLWTRGKHALQMGAEVRLNRDTTIYGVSPNGQYTFGGGTAYSPVEIPSASGQHDIHPGDPLPDTLSGFLAGTPYSYTSAITYPFFPSGNLIGESAIHRDAYGFYFQDQWKARPRFTVTYGLRYEVSSPIRENHHLTSGPAFLGPDGGFVPPWQKGAREELLFYPQPPYRYSTDWGGWAPRLSLEWRAARDTVLSAGAAITTVLPNLYQDNFLTGAFPIVINPYLTAAPGAPIPFVNAPLPVQLPVLFTPRGAPVFASPNSMSVPANTVMDIQRFEDDVAAQTPGSPVQPITMNGMSRNFTDGYIATYTAGVEHHFDGVSFNAAYVATIGVKLVSVAFPNSYPGASPAFAPFTRFNGAGQATGGFGPEYLVSNRSHSTYHSLQVSATKTSPRWGLGFQASYTYSKSLDDSSSNLAGFNAPTLGTLIQTFPQNPWNPGADKGPSTFDLPHVLTFSVVQKLYFDRVGFLRQHLGRRLTSGWELLNVSTLTSGSPFSVFSGIQQTGSGTASADRPDETGNPVFSTSRTVREDYFGLGAQNASFFTIPLNVPSGTGPNHGRFGTLGRDTFRGPGFEDYDFALIKDTSFGRRHGGEAVTLEFRSEFFNIFNGVNFALPANIIRGSGFGLINHTAGPSRQLQFSLKLIY